MWVNGKGFLSFESWFLNELVIIWNKFTQAKKFLWYNIKHTATETCIDPFSHKHTYIQSLCTFHIMPVPNQTPFCRVCLIYTFSHTFNWTHYANLQKNIFCSCTLLENICNSCSSKLSISCFKVVHFSLVLNRLLSPCSLIISQLSSDWLHHANRRF